MARWWAAESDRAQRGDGFKDTIAPRQRDWPEYDVGRVGVRWPGSISGFLCPRAAQR